MAIMKKYICSVCGYVYDEALGDPEGGIVAGIKWEDVPNDWECPLCGAEKADFEEEKNTQDATPTKIKAINVEINEDRELSSGALSALCSNLAKGCEKQYRNEEADLFNELSKYFENRVY